MAVLLRCEPCGRPTLHRDLIDRGTTVAVCTGCAQRREWSDSEAWQFCVEQHRREKLAKLQRENAHLRDHACRLERLLAQAVDVATRGTGVTPLALLAVLEQLDLELSPRNSEGKAA
jgi:hypothetical protein